MSAIFIHEKRYQFIVFPLHRGYHEQLPVLLVKTMRWRGKKNHRLLHQLRILDHAPHKLDPKKNPCPRNHLTGLIWSWINLIVLKYV